MRKNIAAHAEKVELWISRGEIAGLLLTMAAVAMMVKEFGKSELFFVIGLSLLSFVYAFLGIFNREIFGLKGSRTFSMTLLVSYLALSATTVGFLFLQQRWPGAAVIVEIGCAVTAVMFVYFIYKNFIGKIEDESHRNVINNLTVRMLPALLVAGFLIMLYIKN